jgi:hypothetical protein
MSGFDYTAPAELYAARGRTGLRYRRFSHAAEAIQYAIEKLPSNLLLGTRLEVRRHHYDSREIRALYDSAAFPLVRKIATIDAL